MKDRWLRWIFPPIMAYVLYALYTIVSNFAEPDSFSLSFFMVDVLSAYIYYESSRFSIRYFNEKLKTVHLALRLVIQFLVTLLISTLIAVPLYALVKQLYIVYQPQNEVLNIYHLTSQFLGVLVGVIIVFSINVGVDYFNRWAQREVALEQLEKEKIKSQFDLLKSQVDPHFLFNSLNTLHSLIRSKSEFAEEFLMSLSRTMRYSLEGNPDEVISLQKELQVLKSYVFLQERRFGSAFHFSLEVRQQALTSVFVLPFTLQTLVENAIKHNIVSEESPLRLRIFLGADYLVVSNSKALKEVGEDMKLGSGLKNLQQRYGFFSTKAVDVIDTNTHFEVRIPVLYVEEIENIDR